MARVGLCRLNSEGVAALQASYQQGRWANVAAFCAAIGIPRATYYQLIARNKWFEQATILDKLTAIGIPQADQDALCEFRDIEPPLANPNNLPLQPTSFIGRASEKETLKQALSSSPLLTLTGSGGCGKTRLALEVASELLQDFAQGVWLVELAAVTDPDLVGQALLAGLGLREEAGRSALETAITHLKSRHLLLILDNCEHLIAACAQLASALLRSCATVKLLATSREALAISGEIVWRIPSLPTVDPEVLKIEKDPWNLMMDYDACRLFVERSRGHRSDLASSRSSAIAIARICVRLDGIPLAIELAATCVRFLSVGEIEGRLKHRFRLLARGNRMALPRHQTLRALIDWSWELLNVQERVLLARLSVFAGGWTLEAAEQVCGEKEDEILDLLSNLVDKSLVIAEGQGETTRYHLLETVRQYAQDQLGESEESLRVRARHRDYFLELAEAVSPNLRQSKQAHWFGVLEEDHDNLRAAMTFCLGEVAGSETGLRLVEALYPFWTVRAYEGQWRDLVSALLARLVGQEFLSARARVLSVLGEMVRVQGDNALARSLHEQSLALWRELGDRQGIARTLSYLGRLAGRQLDYASARSFHEESLTIYRESGDRAGIVLTLYILGQATTAQGDYVSARALFEETLAIYREQGDRAGIASSICSLGGVAQEQGDLASARSLFEKALALFRELENEGNTADCLLYLGRLAGWLGDYPAARSLLEESLAIYRELGGKYGISLSLDGLGVVALNQGDFALARSLFRESLEVRREWGHQWGRINSVETFASLALHQQRAEHAARLWGAAAALRESGSTRRSNDYVHANLEREVAATREALGEAVFRVLWEEGRAMTLDQAVTYALESTLP